MAHQEILSDSPEQKFWEEHDLELTLQRMVRSKLSNISDDVIHAAERDELLQNIGINQEKAKKLAEFLDTDFSYEQYYQFLNTLFDPQEKMVKVIADYGELAGTQMLMNLSQKLGSEFVDLLIEPALATKIDQFIEFCNAQPKLCETPQAARQNFIVHLGRNPKNIYRAISLKTADLDSFLSSKMYSGEIRELREDENIERKTNNASGLSTQGIQTSVNFHTAGHTNLSRFISVTEFPGVALEQAKNSYGRMNDPNAPDETAVYFIALRVNPFYLVDYGKYLHNKIPKKPLLVYDYISRKFKKVDITDPGVELFLEICPSENAVQSVTKVGISDIPSPNTKGSEELRHRTIPESHTSKIRSILEKYILGKK